MPDSKISALTALVASDFAANDVLPVVDTGATQTKKVAASELLDGLLRVADAGDVLMLDATAEKVIVRQRGGVAGDDEAQLRNDGSNTIIQSMNGCVRITGRPGASTNDSVFSAFTAGGSEIIATPAGNRTGFANGIQIGIGGGYTVSMVGEGLKLGSGATVQFSSGITPATITSVISRVANNVLGVYGTSSADGWIQNRAGRRRITADATTTSTTPANLTALTVNLEAGRHYTFKLVLFTENATAADGLRVDFDGGTATMTDFRAEGYVADSTSVVSLPGVTTLADDLVDTNVSGAALVEINGTLTVNAAGTFIPRLGKEADAAGATLTYRRGSYLWVEDMP